MKKFSIVVYLFRCCSSSLIRIGMVMLLRLLVMFIILLIRLIWVGVVSKVGKF